MTEREDKKCGQPVRWIRLFLLLILILTVTIVARERRGLGSAVASSVRAGRRLSMPFSTPAHVEDRPGVRVAPTVVHIAEQGASAYYTIVLDTRPNAPVSIRVSPDQQTTVEPGELRFDRDNWDVAQTIGVTAVDDEHVEGLHESTIGHTASSSDARYDGIAIDSVHARIQDNDGFRIITDPTNLTVSEPDGSAVFTITLVSEPAAGVTIPLTTSDSECSFLPSPVVLDSGNWNPGVTVTVTAMDDFVADGDKICAIKTEAAISSDPGYDRLDSNDVEVTVQDDDEAGITGIPTELTISEPSASATFTLALTSQPLATVLFSIAPSMKSARQSQLQLCCTPPIGSSACRSQ